MIAKEPVLKATCDACGDELDIPLANRGNGLWYDGKVDAALEAQGWYVMGNLCVCDLCHEQSLEDVA